MVWPSQGDGCNVYCYFNEMTIMKINPCALSHRLISLPISTLGKARAGIAEYKKTAEILCFQPFEFYMV